MREIRFVFLKIRKRVPNAPFFCGKYSFFVENTRRVLARGVGVLFEELAERVGCLEARRVPEQPRGVESQLGLESGTEAQQRLHSVRGA